MEYMYGKALGRAYDPDLGLGLSPRLRSNP